MSASVRNLEHAAQVQFVRAEKAEQRAQDIQHALNLLLNSGFERFHMGLTADGAVHSFELGIVRNLPVPEGTRTTKPTTSLFFCLSGSDKCTLSRVIPNETG